MWRPEFLKEIEDRSAAIGLPDATHEILERNNISVDLQGEVEAVAEHRTGVLFAGNHSSQWEFVGLMDAISRMGRTEMLHIAKFYVQRQVRMALGELAAAAILPVYPRLLASDRGRILNSEILNRIAYRKSLLPLDESARMNELAIQTAGDHLANDGAVNIYPCGSVVDWANNPWRRGLGNIMASVPDEQKETTMVVPYATSGIARGRLLLAVAMQGRGFAGRPQSFTVHFGKPRSIAEIVHVLPPEERDDPQRITDSVRQWALETTQQTAL